MQIIQRTSDVTSVADPAIRDFLTRRIAEMEPDWAPDSWEDYGRFLVLAPGDDPAMLETVGCSYLVSSPFGDERLGDEGFSPVWEWAEDHGSFFEVAVITSDAGNFESMLVPKAGMPPALLKLCAEYAAAAA